MLFFNPTYLFLIIPVLLGWFTQWRVRKIYCQYLKIPNKKKIKGIEVAKFLMSYHHLNLPVLQTKKSILNYYDPKNKTLYLSRQISEYYSITSMGIVAHEIEHAVQDDQGCRFMNFRNKAATTMAVIGQISPLVFMSGILFRKVLFIYLGVMFLFGMVIYALISLPIELNASNRAIRTLKDTGIADQEEIKMVSVVLHHAALTYFAGAAQRIGTFLFIIMFLFIIHQL